MQDFGLGIVIATSLTYAHCAGLFRELTDLNGSAERSCTSAVRTKAEDEQYLSDEEDDESDDEDFDYFDLDELGVDPEEFYELCPNLFSVNYSQPTS